MAWDRVTEEIAHFIGVFHLDVEGLRLRTEYDAFRLKSEDRDTPETEESERAYEAPFALKGFNPELVYLSFGDGPAGLPLPPLTRPEPVERPLEPPVLASYSPETGPPAGVDWPGLTWAFSVPPPLPWSFVVMINQVALLRDDDVLGDIAPHGFVAPQYHFAALLALAETGEAMSAFGPDGPALSLVPTAEEAVAFAEALADVAPPEAGAGVVLRGEAAVGTAVVDGTAVETDLPDLAALLPAHHSDPEEATDPEAPEEDEEEEEADAPKPDVLVLSDLVGDRDGLEPEALPLPIGHDRHEGLEGHGVVTGGNVAINAVDITLSWIDAPVIAVAGDVVEVFAISQVAVLKQSASLPAGIQPAASTTMNAAQITLESSAPEGAPAQAMGLPQAWSVKTVEGDLFAVNWITQTSFITDHDRAEVTFTAEATYFGLGDNRVENLVALREIGPQPDLVLVGGSMISANVIDQVAVLYDVDSLGGVLPADAEVSAGDNLLFNRAEVKQTGIDTRTELDATFAAALDDLQEGKALAASAARDARFEGKEALAALHVTGNLIKLNVIEQRIHLGDSDQIHMALEEFLAGLHGPVEVVTGSNVVANIARIDDRGVDSEVMVGGSVYSEALIYQAELIDTDAPPTGVGMSALASEAVAFLAEDMIGPDPAQTDLAKAAGLQAADQPGSLDVMQGMLA